jgi:hypothetical protein
MNIQQIFKLAEMFHLLHVIFILYLMLLCQPNMCILINFKLRNLGGPVSTKYEHKSIAHGPNSSLCTGANRALHRFVFKYDIYISPILLQWTRCNAACWTQVKTGKCRSCNEESHYRSNRVIVFIFN